MKIALVTTLRERGSGIADYTRRLLPHLRERAEVEVYVAPGLEGEEEGVGRLRSALELRPKAQDQILYQLGNETRHAFMARMVRALGGTVALHDWVLFDLACAAWPGLARGGLRGRWLALREGGLEQALAYHRGRGDAGATAPAFGWHAPEPGGRWTADGATLPAPPEEADALRLVLSGPPGRALRVLAGEDVLAAARLERGDASEALELDLPTHRAGALRLEVAGVAPDPTLRRRGDERRLGVFVRRVEARVAGAWTALDLACLPALAPAEGGLARHRFRLHLNRSVVRHADAFVVHSRWMADRIRRDRNALTPVAVVPHGAERGWRDGDRAAVRRALGLPAEWERAFLVASLGAVQAHKRIDRLVEAVALARRGGEDARLLLVGEARPRELDLEALLERHGLRDAVRVTGWVDERGAHDGLLAADLCANLRGPTTRGASGGAFGAFSAGRAVVVSDLPEYEELPEACAPRVAHGEGEARELARLFARLAADPDERARREAAARAFVEEECHWSRVADRYVEALAGFPRARCAKRSLVMAAVEAGDERRAALAAERAAAEADSA